MTAAEAQARAALAEPRTGDRLELLGQVTTFRRVIRDLLAERPLDRVTDETSTHEERNAGLSDAHSESYRLGWRAGRASAVTDRVTDEMIEAGYQVIRGNWRIIREDVRATLEAALLHRPEGREPHVADRGASWVRGEVR